MKLPFRSRSLGVSQHLKASCASLPIYQVPGFELSLAKLQSNQVRLRSG